MYVDPPAETWDRSTWKDLGMTPFAPCILKVKIVRTSLMSTESATSYFGGIRDDLIHIINDEGYAEVTLIDPLETFLELSENFEVHKCVFDSGFFHLKRNIEGIDYQGISNCPWLAFNPDDVVLVMYNKNQNKPLRERLIILGHSHYLGDNDIDKLISIPPRPGFVGDYYTNYDSLSENCFFGIRDNYLIKYDARYDDYEITVAQHGQCKPLQIRNNQSRYAVDYPNGTLIYSFMIFNAGSTANLVDVTWTIDWYGPRQFHTMKKPLAYKEFGGSTVLEVSAQLLDYPYIATTVGNNVWARMPDDGLSFDVIVSKKQFDEYGNWVGNILTTENYSGGDVGFLREWDVAFKSDASGIVWSTRHERTGDDASAYTYHLDIYANETLYMSYTRVDNNGDPVEGSWITYLYINLDMDTYVYIISEFSPASDPQNTMYYRQGANIVALSSGEGILRDSWSQNTGEYQHYLTPGYFGSIWYLWLDYRPATTHRGRKHLCDISSNDRGDICFLTVPTLDQLLNPATFTYATRSIYSIIEGKLLLDPIIIETFDYLDLTSI